MDYKAMRAPTILTEAEYLTEMAAMEAEIAAMSL